MFIGLSMSMEVVLATLIFGYSLLSIFVTNNKLVQIILAIIAFIAAVM